MGYKNLRACVDDLRRTNQLVEVSIEVDPKLELAEIQRRAYRKKSPALLFTKVKGTRFPMLANLFGTIERTRFLFRDRLRRVQDLVDLKTDPSRALKKFWRYWSAPLTAWSMLPKTCRNGPILQRETTLSQLPQLKCWPNDGGAFVTLPLVYTESPHRPGWQKSNLGMYRVQISGNDYEPDRECGLHYQIHRGIGVHHSEALARGERLPVAVVVGGPPSLIL
ncbi:MAG: UbiD family decarboxylase, partial [Gemmataceae bacterium]|nr:UbiD family decarboxylase [Gemmataceae bacterium]